MKKLNIMAILMLICILLAACSSTEDVKTTSEQTENNYAGSTQSVNESENKSSSQSDQIVLEPNNPYMEVNNIDIASCHYENGYFTGEMTYTVHSTQKYVDEYDDYFYREVYFAFYDKSGNLVGEDISQNNHLYSRDYTYSNTAYVMFATESEIEKVEVSKIVCEKN